MSNFDAITNNYDLGISHLFLGFLQKFQDVTICTIHVTETTTTRCVRMELRWISAPAVT